MATLEETCLEAAMQKSERVTHGWRYEIQHGPDGEANYAWLYRGNEMIATMKTHHAAALTAALAVQTQQGVEVKDWHRSDNAYGGVMLYSLREDGWRKGAPVMVNDVTIRIERATGSETDIEPIVQRIRSALVDVPAVESEPDGWLCSAPPGVWSSGRVDTDNANVQAWRDRDYTCIPYWLSPSVAHPPRSLSNEGWRPIERPWVDDETAILERLADGDTIVFSMDGDMAWFTKGDRAFVGNAIMSLREKGYLLRKRDVVDDADDPRGIADYDTISEAGRLFLSTRKGSAEGDGSATSTIGGDHA